MSRIEEVLQRVSKQDKAYYEQAISLINTAARAAEEAEQYIEDIQDSELRKLAEREMEAI